MLDFEGKNTMTVHVLKKVCLLSRQTNFFTLSFHESQSSTDAPQRLLGASL